MLVLTRKAKEKVMIGPDIVVSVVEIRGDRVRIGITAPDDVAVHREEVWIKIALERSQAVLVDIHEEALV